MSYWNRKAVSWFDFMLFQAVSYHYLRNSTTTYNHILITCLWEFVLVIILSYSRKVIKTEKNDKQLLQKAFLTTFCTVSSNRLMKHLT